MLIKRHWRGGVLVLCLILMMVVQSQTHFVLSPSQRLPRTHVINPTMESRAPELSVDGENNGDQIVKGAVADSDLRVRCADEEEDCTEKTGPFEDITTLVLSAVLLCLVLIGVLVYMSRD